MAREVLRKVDLLKGTIIPRDIEVTVTRHYGNTAAEKSNELLLHMGIAVLGVSALIWLTLGWREACIVAIAIPEIPRVTRLVRSLVLTLREEPYVEAAVSLGTPMGKIMFGHILPNTVAPLIVQGTYIVGFAILIEAILSFLGVGLPPDIPTWGNIMAEGRVQFVGYPHNVFFPGIFLAVTVLAVNMLGDGLRDALDPKLAKRV